MMRQLVSLACCLLLCLTVGNANGEQCVREEQSLTREVIERFLSHVPDSVAEESMESIALVQKIANKYLAKSRENVASFQSASRSEKGRARGKRSGGDGDLCPEHPYPYTPLPQPLPAALSSAFKLVEYLYDELDNTGIIVPAGSMSAVIYDDEIIHTMAIGSTNKTSSPNGPPADLDTIFRIGSISKLFPAIQVMQLWEKRLIRSLDDPVCDTNPDFTIRNQFSSSSRITWKSMMCHMSGLPRQAPCETCIDNVTCVDGAKPNCRVSTNWVLNQTAQEAVVLPLYTRPSYSNLGFGLLGHLPRRIQGIPSEYAVPFEQYVEENIFQPMNMSSSGYVITEEVYEQMAQGYDGYNPYNARSNRVGGWQNPSGGAFSSVRDLSKLMISFIKSHDMKDSPILTADSMKMMSQIAFNDWSGSTAMAYPFESFFIDSYFIRCKAGNINGFSGVTCFNPDLKLGIVSLFNTNLNTFRYVVPALEVIVPALREVLSSLPIVSLLPPNPSSYTGEFTAYPPGSSNMVIIIELRDNEEEHRLVQYLKQAKSYFSTLVYVGENMFQVVAPNDSPSRFIGPTCQDTELSAFQYEVVIFNDDLSGFKMPGNGGAFVRAE